MKNKISGFFLKKLAKLCPYFCLLSIQFSSVQLLSHVRLFATPWTTARQTSLSITNISFQGVSVF